VIDVRTVQLRAPVLVLVVALTLFLFLPVLVLLEWDGSPASGITTKFGTRPEESHHDCMKQLKIDTFIPEPPPTPRDATDSQQIGDAIFLGTFGFRRIPPYQRRPLSLSVSVSVSLSLSLMHTHTHIPKHTHNINAATPLSWNTGGPAV